MRKLWKVFRGIFVVFATIALSTVALNAIDNSSDLSDSMLGLVLGLEERDCPAEMVLVPSHGGGFCIDIYEASAGSGCMYSEPKNQNETRINLETSSCKAESTEGAYPWTNVARHQAELACAKAGKRLATNKEWYTASLGSPDAPGYVERGDCNINDETKPSKTGSFSRCISSHGLYDAIGNVWEWVSESVVDGEYLGRTLPQEGYVFGIDADGISTETRDFTSNMNFNEDYFSISHDGVRGMFRGGYYRSGTDAGMYAVNAITPPSFSGGAVGFRCAQ